MVLRKILKHYNFHKLKYSYKDHNIIIIFTDILLKWKHTYS